MADDGPQALSGLVDMCEVADYHLHTAALVGRPLVEPLRHTVVGEAERLVELRHIGLVDAADREAAHPQAVVAEEIGRYAVADMQLQLQRRMPREQQRIVVARAEGRQAALDEVLAQEADVVVFANALEHEAEEVGVGLQDALCLRVACYAADSLHAAYGAQQRVADGDGQRLCGLLCQEVLDADMAAEAHHLVADGVFEAENDRHGDNHDGQSDGYAGCGYPHGRAADGVLSAVRAVYASRKKIR